MLPPREIEIPQLADPEDADETMPKQSNGYSAVEGASSAGHESTKQLLFSKASLTIASCFLGACIATVLNYCLFSYLDGRRPDTSLSQRWASTIAVILANLIRSLLGISLGIAYIQLVWYRLRGRWMTARLVESLLALPYTPLNLFDRKAIFAAKLEWLFALFCIVLPIATTFPPAALSVSFSDVADLDPVVLEVPWLDLTYRRDDSVGATAEAALFIMDNKMVISDIKEHIRTLATNVLRSGEIAPWSNPAASLPNGRNNTYQVRFRGPRLQCDWETNSMEDLQTSAPPPPKIDGFPDFKELERLANFQYYWPYDDSTSTQFPLGNVAEDGEHAQPSFTVYFRNYHTLGRQFSGLTHPDNDLMPKGSDIFSIRCVVGSSYYTVHVTHGVGDRSFHLSYGFDDEQQFIPIINTTNYADPSKPDSHSDSGLSRWFVEGWLWNNRTNTFTAVATGNKEGGLGSVADSAVAPASANGTTQTFAEKFFDMQSVSVALAMADSLGGFISDFGSHAAGALPIAVPRKTIKTNILATKFAKVNESSHNVIELHLDITPAGLEQAFENITLSLLSLNKPGWTKATAVTLQPWSLIYSFSKERLLIPYTVVITVALLFNMIGLRALLRNEVSAKGNSFLQIVTTTSAGAFTALREKAAECSRGGEENFSKELLDLPLKFGPFLQPASHVVDERKHPAEDETENEADGMSRSESVAEAGFVWDAWGFGTKGEIDEVRYRHHRSTIVEA
ncbi:hypothetical protein BJ508DRAFT_378890 [Ascobolus immersus RN42]|uniref:Uncharacterized protein n=1 Tax=Ascobolus immersus RN42 TaxID=1160509 RepID=A0A3N4HW82_ASCIM|nr:hypothetical protein BJ508DRAFT_378890 [Ascobolus immersus RN42]